MRGRRRHELSGILTLSVQTYYAAYCVGAEPGVVWYRPLFERYDCDDGGFGFYKRCALTSGSRRT